MGITVTQTHNTGTSPSMCYTGSHAESEQSVKCALKAERMIAPLKDAPHYSVATHDETWNSFFSSATRLYFSYSRYFATDVFQSGKRHLYWRESWSFALLQHVMKWTLMTHGKYLTSCPLITVYETLTLQLRKSSKSGECAHAPAVPKLKKTLARLIIIIESDVIVFVLITFTPGIVKYLPHGWFVLFWGGFVASVAVMLWSNYLGRSCVRLHYLYSAMADMFLDNIQGMNVRVDCPCVLLACLNITEISRVAVTLTLST